MAPPGRNRFQTLGRKIDPGMSRAMAGNTGLTGLTEGQVDNIVRGQTAVNRFLGDTTPVTFQSVGQRFGETGSKYRRPADKISFANEMAMLNKGIGAGGKFFVGADGVPRFSFTNTGIKNPETGATILSRQLPQIRATAPTLNQVGGDIARAFTGFDSLKFVDPRMQGPMQEGQNRNMAFMQRTPGMFNNFKSPTLAILEGVGGFFNNMGQKTSEFNLKLMQLTPAQRRIYDQNIIIPGTTPQQAYNKAVGMAMGGIATLQ
jgi:hypothetical protein